MRHKDHTELAYVLELPKEAGPAQDEFDVKEEASYVISVKNPKISTPGAPGAQKPPSYPTSLQEKFGDRRWIDKEDLKEVAQSNRNLVEQPDAIINVISCLPDRRDTGMADVETEVGKLL